MDKNRTTERNVAVFCTAMVIGAVIVVVALNLFGLLYEPSKKPDPIKTEKVGGDSVKVTCPSCGMCITRELNEKNYVNQ